MAPRAADITKRILAAENGLYALGLYGVLRAEHACRCARGETFAINAPAMKKAGSVPGFSREGIEKGRDTLLRLGLLEIVERGQNTVNGRKSTQYRIKMDL